MQIWSEEANGNEYSDCHAARVAHHQCNTQLKSEGRVPCQPVSLKSAYNRDYMVYELTPRCLRQTGPATSYHIRSQYTVRRMWANHLIDHCIRPVNRGVSSTSRLHTRNTTS